MWLVTQEVTFKTIVPWPIIVCLEFISDLLLLRSFRHSADRQFTWWVHGHLGKTIRRVIPSCAVKKIRGVFPSEDGSYTGYIPGDDDDSAFDSELEKAWRDFLNI